MGTRKLRELFVFGLFFFTTFNAAFLQPRVILVSGERSKLFTALFCTLTLLAAVFLIKGAWRKFRSMEGLVSLVLLVLAVLSGVMSPYQPSAFWRSLTVISSALSGFWCARILLDTPSRRSVFAMYEFMLLGGMLLVCMGTYFARGDVWQLLDSNPHPLVCRIMLMSFSLLVMAYSRRRLLRGLGVLGIVLSFAVYSLSTLRSAMFMPLVVGGALLVVAIVRVRNVAAFILPVIIAIGTLLYCSSIMESKLSGDFFRLENYAFSWEIATDNPWLGMGLMAPRDDYLEKHEIFFDSMSQEFFVGMVRGLISSENVFLTFMAGLGMPFTFLYAASVMALFVILVRRRRRTSRRMTLPFPALFFPITAGLLHFMISDGLLQPHISWFFHILLGMIPVRDARTGSVPQPPSGQ